MKSQQICQLLIETPVKQIRENDNDSFEDLQIDIHQSQSQYVKYKLQQILNCLQEQTRLFQFAKKKQHQENIQKVNIQKDQIIEQLLKNIYNLKRQNEQLNFQFKRRFKVIKNLQTKYQNLIDSKNKKIIQMQSIIKYLQKKLKHAQRKLGMLQNSQNNSFSKNKFQILSKSISPDINLNHNKISLIISKPNNRINQKSNHFSRNSLQELTMPLKSSLISLSKVTSSSRTIAKNDKNLEQNFQDPRQSIFLSSMQCSTQQYLNDKNYDQETRFQEVSRIRPICLEKSASSTSNYLNLQDFHEIDRCQNMERDKPMRRSQQINSSKPMAHQNRFNLHQ